MRLGPRLTWDDIDMRMEYVGARATCHPDIDMALNEMARRALMVKNKFVNAHVCAQCSAVSSSATLTFFLLAVERNIPGNYALQDYQRQLTVLEQQKKKRSLMARQEQDTFCQASRYCSSTRTRSDHSWYDKNRTRQVAVDLMECQ